VTYTNQVYVIVKKETKGHVVYTVPNRTIKSIGWIPWLKEAMKDVVRLR
jgi:hypothetical protein